MGHSDSTIGMRVKELLQLLPDEQLDVFGVETKVDHQVGHFAAIDPPDSVDFDPSIFVVGQCETN